MNTMKNTVIVLLLTTLIGSTSAIDLTKWEHQTNVIFSENPSEYCKLEITPELYHVARRDMSDIRLITQDGEQKPYLVIKPRDISERHKYSPVTLNKSTDADGNSLVTLDFGEQLMKNSLEVITEGKSFRRAVKVEGSNDNISFLTIVEKAYVFAVGDKNDSRFETIDLPANDYRYLRIIVEPMTTEKDSPVIKATKAFRCVKKPAQRQPVKMTHITQAEDEKYKLSIYEYDLGFSNLPISEVNLDIAEESFYRYVTFEGRDSVTRTVKIPSEDNRERFREVDVPWTNIGCATIYRYTDASGKKRENVTLSILRPTYRYLRITIKNYDDRPLDISSVSAEMIAGQLMFPSENGIATELYVGSETAPTPQYDIRRHLRNPSEIKASTVAIGSIMENPIFGKAAPKQIPWTEKHQTPLLIILGVIVAIIGVFMLKSFKSIQAEQSEET